MKNIHIIPTDKPSRLHLGNSGLILYDLVFNPTTINAQHIYITSDEEIKEGDWFYCFQNNNVLKCFKKEGSILNGYHTQYKKVALTTDPDLIKDGVQAIDDEFLEWFVKNPSCEEVGIQKQYQYHSSKEFYIDADYVDCTKEQYESIKKEIPTCPLRILYKIIIPKEEPKQETLEKVAENEASIFYEKGTIEWNKYRQIFKDGAKWQAERMYSEEEVFKLICDFNYDLQIDEVKNINDWFEQFKKK